MKLTDVKRAAEAVQKAIDNVAVVDPPYEKGLADALSIIKKVKEKLDGKKAKHGGT